jgi:hypothetical protein
LLPVNASLRWPDERVEVEGCAFKRERGVEGFESAQRTELGVNKLPVLEEERAGRVRVFDLKPP